jgi:hypothetical protein
MKNSKSICSLFIISLVITGCNFSKGIKTDLKTGLTYAYNGFRVEGVKAYDTYLKPLKGNKLPETSTLHLEIDNIKGPVETEGKIYPGCSLTVTDKEGNVLIDKDDLYKDTENGLSPEEFVKPIIKVVLANPIVAGKVYTVRARFYDKKKESSYLEVNMDVELTPSEQNIGVSARGLAYERVFFDSEKTGPLPCNKVLANTNAGLGFAGLQGFAEQDGMVFPGAELIVTDSDGKQVLHEEDIFKDITVGLTPDQAKMLMAIIPFQEPIKSGATYRIKARFFDKKNENNEITADLDVEVIK